MIRPMARKARDGDGEACLGEAIPEISHFARDPGKAMDEQNRFFAGTRNGLGEC